MKYKELLEKYHKDKTPIFINGMGIGKIIKVEEDYIDFEVIKKKEKKLFKEVLHILDIATISIGEKEIPKTEQEKKIDTDLGDI